MMVQRFRLPRRASAFAMSAALLTSAAVMGPSVTAQTTYTCFPTCSTTDGRMLSLAGSGIDAFSGNDITIGFGLPPNASSLEIGIFDPDSKAGTAGGRWDNGTSPITFELYADPNGDGTGAVKLATIVGDTLNDYDNLWYTITRSVDAAARAENGNYVYFLRASMPTTAGSRSAFKLRTNGTITVRSYQSFSIEAPLPSGREAAIIYPNYLLTTDASVRYTNPSYDGNWSIYLDVISPSSELTIWDGDMDFGTDPSGTWPGKPTTLPVDTDDDDTPNARPSWAANDTVTVLAEGVRAPNPYDDHLQPYYRRSPAVRYDVIFPDGTTTFANENPSGGREWEQFKIGTGTFDRNQMDAATASIPAGIYTVRVQGMDMWNVNSWRFFNNVVSAPGTSNVEVIGVNEAGLPVAPIRAIETVNGSISGTIYYDSDESFSQGPGEPGLPTVSVHLYRSNGEGGWTEVTGSPINTNIDGNFTYSKIGAGSYRVAIDDGTLQTDVVATHDADGVSTEHTAEVTISSNSPNRVATFGYRRGAEIGTLTRGYWVNHEENWPVTGLYLGGEWYDKEAALTVLRRATKGDKSYSMAAQLIATKLNLANGTDATCIGSDVVSADTWLASNPMNRGKTSVQAWSTGATVHDRLDDYNNGRLCVGHMD